MSFNYDPDLVKYIENATRKALKSLFDKHKEKFYYCTLATTGEGHCPVISAWSEEALERMLVTEKDPDKIRREIEWSYADSPYFAYGEEFFVEVREVFLKRTKLINNDDEFQKEYEIRVNSMEKVMANLDKEGLFGEGNQRLSIVINAEVMPPDYTNTERALRLNPREALTVWLEEVAEW